MTTQKELKDIKEFTQDIRMLSLGDLIDKLISIRLEELSSSEDSVSERSERTLRKGALKIEISRRETGRDDEEPPIPGGGVRSLGNLF